MQYAEEPVCDLEADSRRTNTRTLLAARSNERPGPTPLDSLF